MEASLSKRDALFRRNFVTFRKITSGQQYGNQNSGPKSLLSSGFYFRTSLNLGQSSKNEASSAPQFANSAISMQKPWITS
jgi:hypothetical protein